MAGTASSLMGFLQTGIGAIAGIVVGHALNASALPMALVMLAMALASSLSYGFLIAPLRSEIKKL